MEGVVGAQRPVGVGGSPAGVTQPVGAHGHCMSELLHH